MWRITRRARSNKSIACAKRLVALACRRVAPAQTVTDARSVPDGKQTTPQPNLVLHSGRVFFVSVLFPSFLSRLLSKRKQFTTMIHISYSFFPFFFVFRFVIRVGVLEQFKLFGSVGSSPFYFISSIAPFFVFCYI